MNQGRRGKEIAKPRSGMSAMHATNAAQHVSARRKSCHRMASGAPAEDDVSAVLATRKSDTTTIAPPYHIGKKPAPGPASPMYTQRFASARIHAPRPPSASPDQKSPRPTSDITLPWLKP